MAKRALFAASAGALLDCGGYPDGATWTSIVDTIVDAMINPTFCESPSGAFVD